MSTHTDEKRVQEIRERLENAADDPHYFDSLTAQYTRTSMLFENGDAREVTFTGEYGVPESSLGLYRNAPADIEYLLSVIDAQKQQIEQLQEDLNDLRETYNTTRACWQSLEEVTKIQGGKLKKLSDVDLAIGLSRIVHNKCKDVPHDIGLHLTQFVQQFCGLSQILSETNDSSSEAGTQGEETENELGTFTPEYGEPITVTFLPPKEGRFSPVEEAD